MRRQTILLPCRLDVRTVEQGHPAPRWATALMTLVRATWELEAGKLTSLLQVSLARLGQLQAGPVEWASPVLLRR
jgi:hypothetical protein